MFKQIFLASILSVGCLTASEGSDPKASQQLDQLQIEHTLSIIKPEAVENNTVGEIIEYLENAGLKIVGSKMVRLTPEQAKAFYAAHKDKAFFPELVEYMSSGPVIVQVLEGEDAVAVNRQVMGATDPGKASPGTIRSDFGVDIQRNAVHGSDSLDNAKKEIGFFFTSDEIYVK